MPVTTINPDATVGSLVLDHPALAPLLERLELDFCCHGDVPLATACTEHGLDVDTTVRLLAAQAAAGGTEPAHAFDARSATAAELCAHIVSEHHDRLRSELPRLEETAATVVRVHGGDDPRLAHLAATLDRLAADVLAHVEREEMRLFPCCVAVEGGGAIDDDALLDELEHDHADVGEGLRELRELADGYAPETARCGTHRSLLSGLAELERDLHLHIHEENNVLFPRVRSRLTAAKGAAQ
jgi:regulator of cell morphogenesis and NO signaling